MKKRQDIHKLYTRHGAAEKLHSTKRRAARLEIIQELAKVFKKNFGLPVETTGTLETIIASIRKELPLDPKKMPKDEKTLKNACILIADVFNGIFGPEFINEDLPVAELCQEISDKMYSLTMQLTGEREEILANTKILIKNIGNITRGLKSSFESMKNRSVAAKDLHRIALGVLEKMVKNLEVIVDQRDDRDDINQLKELRRYFKTFDGHNNVALSKLFDTTFNMVSTLKKVDKLGKKLGVTRDELKKIASATNPGEALAGAVYHKVQKSDESYLKAYDALRHILSNREIEGGSSMQFKNLIKKTQKRVDKLVRLFFDAFNNIFNQIEKLTKEFLTEIRTGAVKFSRSETFAIADRIKNLPRISNLETYYQLSGAVDEVKDAQKRFIFTNGVKKIIKGLRAINLEGKSKTLTKICDLLEDLLTVIEESCNKFSTEPGLVTGRGDIDQHIENIRNKVSSFGTAMSNFGSIFQSKPKVGSSEVDDMVKDFSLGVNKLGDISTDIIYEARRREMIDHMNKVALINKKHYSDYEKITAKSVAQLKDEVLKNHVTFRLYNNEHHEYNELLRELYTIETLHEKSYLIEFFGGNYVAYSKTQMIDTEQDTKKTDNVWYKEKIEESSSGKNDGYITSALHFRSNTQRIKPSEFDIKYGDIDVSVSNYPELFITVTNFDKNNINRSIPDMLEAARNIVKKKEYDNKTYADHDQTGFSKEIWKVYAEDLLEELNKEKSNYAIDLLNLAENLDNFYKNYLQKISEKPKNIENILLDFQTEIFSEENEIMNVINKPNSDGQKAIEIAKIIGIKQECVIVANSNKSDSSTLITIKTEDGNSALYKVVGNEVVLHSPKQEELPGYNSSHPNIFLTITGYKHQLKNLINLFCRITGYNGEENYMYPDKIFDILSSFTQIPAKISNLPQHITNSIMGVIAITLDVYSFTNKKVSEGYGIISDNVRYILGASETVRPELTEFYIRAVLLAKFYKKFFVKRDNDIYVDGKKTTDKRPKDIKNPREENIIVLSELEGPFKKLYKYSNDDFITSSKASKIISICNILWDKHKTSSDPLFNAMLEISEDANSKLGYMIWRKFEIKAPDRPLVANPLKLETGLSKPLPSEKYVSVIKNYADKPHEDMLQFDIEIRKKITNIIDAVKSNFSEIVDYHENKNFDEIKIKKVYDLEKYIKTRTIEVQQTPNKIAKMVELFNDFTGKTVSIDCIKQVGEVEFKIVTENLIKLLVSEYKRYFKENGELADLLKKHAEHYWPEKPLQSSYFTDKILVFYNSNLNLTKTHETNGWKELKLIAYDASRDAGGKPQPPVVNKNGDLYTSNIDAFNDLMKMDPVLFAYLIRLYNHILEGKELHKWETYAVNKKATSLLMGVYGGGEPKEDRFEFNMKNKKYGDVVNSESVFRHSYTFSNTPVFYKKASDMLRIIKSGVLYDKIKSLKCKNLAEFYDYYKDVSITSDKSIFEIVDEKHKDLIHKAYGEFLTWWKDSNTKSIIDKYIRVFDEKGEHFETSPYSLVNIDLWLGDADDLTGDDVDVLNVIEAFEKVKFAEKSVLFKDKRDVHSAMFLQYIALINSKYTKKFDDFINNVGGEQKPNIEAINNYFAQDPLWSKENAWDNRQTIIKKYIGENKKFFVNILSFIAEKQIIGGEDTFEDRFKKYKEQEKIRRQKRKKEEEGEKKDEGKTEKKDEGENEDEEEEEVKNEKAMLEFISNVPDIYDLCTKISTGELNAEMNEYMLKQLGMAKQLKPNLLPPSEEELKQPYGEFFQERILKEVPLYDTIKPMELSFIKEKTETIIAEKISDQDVKKNLLSTVDDSIFIDSLYHFIKLVNTVETSGLLEGVNDGVKNDLSAETEEIISEIIEDKLGAIKKTPETLFQVFSFFESLGKTGKNKDKINQIGREIYGAFVNPVDEDEEVYNNLDFFEFLYLHKNKYVNIAADRKSSPDIIIDGGKFTELFKKYMELSGVDVVAEATYFDSDKEFEKQVQTLRKLYTETINGQGIWKNLINYFNSKHVFLERQFAKMFTRYILKFSENRVLTEAESRYRYFYSKIISPIFEGELSSFFENNRTVYLDTVLFNSMSSSYTLLNPTKPGTRKYVEENFELLPEFMKLKMKRYVPYFKRKFRNFCDKCIYFKELMGSFNKSDMKVNSTAVISVNKLINMCQIINKILIDLEDLVNPAPITGELGKDRIMAYKSIYGNTPLLPTSIFLPLVFQHENNAGDLKYASRAIIGEYPVNSTHFPGVFDILELYNGAVDEDEKIDRDSAVKLTEIMCEMMRIGYDSSNDIYLKSHSLANVFKKNIRNLVEDHITQEEIDKGVINFKKWYRSPDEYISILEESSKMKAMKLYCDKDKDNNAYMYINILNKNFMPFNLGLLYRSTLFAHIQLLSHGHSFNSDTFRKDIAKVLQKYIKNESHMKHAYELLVVDNNISNAFVNKALGNIPRGKPTSTDDEGIEIRQVHKSNAKSYDEGYKSASTHTTKSSDGNIDNGKIEEDK